MFLCLRLQVPVTTDLLGNKFWTCWQKCTIRKKEKKRSSSKIYCPANCGSSTYKSPKQSNGQDESKKYANYTNHRKIIKPHSLDHCYLCCKAFFGMGSYQYRADFSFLVQIWGCHQCCLVITIRDLFDKSQQAGVTDPSPTKFSSRFETLVYWFSLFNKWFININLPILLDLSSTADCFNEIHLLWSFFLNLCTQSIYIYMYICIIYIYMYIYIIYT